MVSKIKKVVLLAIYFLSPIIASIIYWFEEPMPFSLNSTNMLMDLLHRTGSILGIFSYVWMCFNIVIMIKIKLIEENFSLEKLLKFHTIMSIIALFLGAVHYPLLRLIGMYSDSQVISGTIGLLIFLSLMILAIIFMTNRLIKHLRIEKLRVFAYKKKFSYGVNKVLHNVTLLAVLVIFIHTLISHTSAISLLMRIVYFIFFDIALIGWVCHKIVRKLRVESDPYINRMVSWDTKADIIPWLYQGTNSDWALQLIKQNPSLYPCLQCGTCTSQCPVSIFTMGEYNSRKLVQCILKGLKSKILTDMEPNVWQCTQCYTCVETCPQHVELPEIIIFIRNKLAEQSQAPAGFLNEAKVVYKHGESIPLQNAIIKRRETLGLQPHPDFDLQDIQDIMNMAGLNKLIPKQSITKSELETKNEIMMEKEVKTHSGSS